MSSEMIRYLVRNTWQENEDVCEAAGLRRTRGFGRPGRRGTKLGTDHDINDMSPPVGGAERPLG